MPKFHDLCQQSKEKKTVVSIPVKTPNLVTIDLSDDRTPCAEHPSQNNPRDVKPNPRYQTQNNAMMLYLTTIGNQTPRTPADTSLPKLT